MDNLLAIAQEHMLCSAQSYRLGAETQGKLRILRVVGIDANVESAAIGAIKTNLIRPCEQSIKVFGQ